MSWRTPDREPYGYEHDDNLRLHGTTHPDRTDHDALHDDQLAAADRLAEKAPLAYVERPTDRERVAHRQEAEARNTLRPRTGHVTVQPRRLPCTCGAATQGLRAAGPGHRYSCPLYSHRLDDEVQAA